MQVAKWGNSLAIRIPVDVVRELGLKEGDTVDLCALDDAKVALISERQRREAAVKELEKFRGWMPADYKFDRDEVHER
ncbi:MAG: AbrB/MazE/SpoVT family DNA-binding domain-containing protein [Pseudomonadota bacterium]|nr:AbrB/MazE/SpoVT family DNA-binding domain-containing protein [Pseudomonadota bacterium]